jgi:hypothetical protein
MIGALYIFTVLCLASCCDIHLSERLSVRTIQMARWNEGLGGNFWVQPHVLAMVLQSHLRAGGTHSCRQQF